MGAKKANSKGKIVYLTALSISGVGAHRNGRAARIPLGVYGIFRALIASSAAGGAVEALATALLIGSRAVGIIGALLDALRVISVGVGALESVWAALLVFWPRVPVAVGTAALSKLYD